MSENIKVDFEVDWSMYAGKDTKQGKNAFVKFYNNLIDRGCELRSPYTNTSNHVLIDYKCGHELSYAKPSNFSGGKGCKKCGEDRASSKRSIQSKKEFVDLVKSNGHKLLSEYINNRTHVYIDFNCGHEPRPITPSNYKSGKGCKKCSGNCTEQAKEDFMNMLKQNGHELLSEYINAKTKVYIDFNCGHKPSPITPNDYKSGKGCKKCSGNCTEQAKEDFMNMLKQNGHELLSEYTHAHTKVYIDFKCGHKPHTISPNKYKSGKGCPKCAGLCPEQAKEDLINLVKKNGHELLSEYVDAKTKVLIDFKCGHDPHLVTPSDYKSGSGCPKCSESKGEKIIYNHLIDNGYDVVSQLVINGYSYKYDIYIKEYNLLVEIHGIQHYEEVEFFSNRTLEEEQENDGLKLELALSKGYNYMVIDYREHDPNLALKRFKEQFKAYTDSIIDNIA